MTWTPATPEEVRRTIDAVARHAGPEIWAAYALKLVQPYAAQIERFGRAEKAFVVARFPERVVFFDDVEDDFGTADEIDGKLSNCAMYADLRVALREAEAGA